MGSKYKVNQRLKIANDYCTVRFVGEIPNWPSEAALGLEWDNEERGKNNGSLNGVRYFVTRNERRSGSFIKASSKKLEGSAGRSFINALCETYGKGIQNYESFSDLFNVEGEDASLSKERDMNVQEIKLGSKVVESYGFEQLDKLQSNFQKLEVISLNSAKIANNINDFRTTETVKVSEILPNLRTMDLSYNLWSDLEEVLALIESSKVEKLNLNGNRFYNSSYSDSCTPIVSVKYLSLSETYLTNLDCVAQYFPNVEELTLASNGIHDTFDLEPLAQLKQLRALDISFNNYFAIPYDQLSKFPSLEKLIISNNSITLRGTQSTINGIKELDMRTNSISSFDEIDSLNLSFPHLQKLRINDNPLFAGQDKESEGLNKIDEGTIEAIARLSPNVTVFNRTTVNINERDNYELYFISKIAKDRANYKNFFKTNRWAMLCDKYHVHPNDDEKSSLNSTNTLSTNIISLSIELGNGKVIQKDTFKYYTVGHLKGLISKMVDNRCILDFKIYYELNSTLKEYLRDDLSMIQSTGVSQHDTIHVEFFEHSVQE